MKIAKGILSNEKKTVNEIAMIEKNIDQVKRRFA